MNNWNLRRLKAVLLITLIKCSWWVVLIAAIVCLVLSWYATAVLLLVVSIACGLIKYALEDTPYIGG